MTTIEELAAKVESLTERVAMLERCIEALGVAAVEKNRGRGDTDATLVADIARHPLDRETTVGVARVVLRPMVALIPTNLRAAAASASRR